MEYIEVSGADCCYYCTHYTRDDYESCGRCELLKQMVSDTDICSKYNE